MALWGFSEKNERIVRQPLGIASLSHSAPKFFTVLKPCLMGPKLTQTMPNLTQNEPKIPEKEPK